MSDTATTPPAAVIDTDPYRVVPARLDPAGVGNIFRLLRTLVAYGRNLVEKLREEDDPDDLPWYAFLTSIFGTTNPALITVTVIRGLLRATALQARLRSLSPLPLQARAAEQTKARGRRPSRGPAQGQPRAAGWSIPPGWPGPLPSAASPRPRRKCSRK